MDQVTPEKYRYYVELAINRIRTHIPKVIINLINAFDVSQIIPVFYTHLDYCYARVGASETPCSCAATNGT
ncbi:hypothetical protein INT48_000656 [Thamnidium elegans]|uniref:Uncharacterized protein n=1 Tax=Thamnidium elegans TaxID=101142 RepID=A0A8H7VTN3_9FUNG|nr:hypothetical protein INT48_000656 [Thamnidium elegans]